MELENSVVCSQTLNLEFHGLATESRGWRRALHTRVQSYSQKQQMEATRVHPWMNEYSGGLFNLEKEGTGTVYCTGRRSSHQRSRAVRRLRSLRAAGCGRRGAPGFCAPPSRPWAARRRLLVARSPRGSRRPPGEPGLGGGAAGRPLSLLAQHVAAQKMNERSTVFKP